MKTVLKFILLVLVLNVVRYLIAGPIEAFTIMGPMHQPMVDYSDCFNSSFSNVDWITSFLYNFMVWFFATWVFYLTHSNVAGNFIVKSFKIYGLMCLFFMSVTAVYMNHYIGGIRTFYQYAIIDAIITFSVVALANGLIYPMLFKH